MMQFNRFVKTLIHQHSGGMKLGELVTEIVAAAHENSLDNSSELKRTNFSTVLQLVKSIPDIKVLEYTWHQSRDHGTSKHFVYTP